MVAPDRTWLVLKPIAKVGEIHEPIFMAPEDCADISCFVGTRNRMAFTLNRFNKPISIHWRTVLDQDLLGNVGKVTQERRRSSAL